MNGQSRAQNPDRFRAKRTLDVDLARRDVGQVWCRNVAQQRERIGATPRQGFGRQPTCGHSASASRNSGSDKFWLCSWLAAGSVRGGAKRYGSDCPTTSQHGFRI